VEKLLKYLKKRLKVHADIQELCDAYSDYLADNRYYLDQWYG